MTFSRRLLSNSLPPGKNVRSNITKFPTPRNDLWSRARTKIQISLPPGQQENSNALPPGQIKAIDQNPGLFFVLLVTISKPPRIMSSSANYRPFLSSSRHILPQEHFVKLANKTFKKRKNSALLTLRRSQKHYEIFSNNVLRKNITGNS